MNDILDHDDPSLSRQDRELTLGTGTILGMFLALAVICGACFGGGYYMGHKSQPTPLTLTDNSPDAITGSSMSKTPAGSPSISPDEADSNTAPAVIVAPAPAHKPAPVVHRPALAASSTPDSTEAGLSAKAAEPARSLAAKPVSPAALLPSANPAGGSGSAFIMVQVAAVSHQEDADLLMGALRARGYAVMARKGSGDPLIHVQVGPFNNKPAAEAMRQKLIGDGYNAMLKY